MDWDLIRIILISLAVAGIAFFLYKVRRNSEVVIEDGRVIRKQEEISKLSFILWAITLFACLALIFLAGYWVIANQVEK